MGLAACGVNAQINLTAKGGGHDVLAHNGRVHKAENAVGKVADP